MSPSGTIRLAMKSDARALAQLTSELGYPATPGETEDRLARLIPDPHHAIFVADNGMPIGWIQVSIIDSLEGGMFAEIAGLVVSARLRRSGTGGELVTQAEKWARLNGCLRLRVRTNIVRTEARAFYAKQGFSLTKTQEVFDKHL